MVPAQRHVRNALDAARELRLFDYRDTTPLKARAGRRHALRRRGRDGDAGRRRRRRAGGRLRRRAAGRRIVAAHARPAACSTTSWPPSWRPSRDLTLLCGRYEGFDERVHEHLADDAVSIGRYVLAGGELPAMVVADAMLRKLPGALGDEESAVEESFSEALEGAPEYPHYTRPAGIPGLGGPGGAALRRPRQGPRLAVASAAGARGQSTRRVVATIRAPRGARVAAPAALYLRTEHQHLAQ